MAVVSESKSESLRKTLEKHKAKGSAIENAIENTPAIVIENVMDIEPSIQSKINSKSKKIQVFPFWPSGLTDLLVAMLLLIRDKSEVQSESEQQQSSSGFDLNSTSACVGVSQTLAKCLPGVYIPALTNSVSDLVATHRNANAISLPKTVLQLWISLFTNAKLPLGIHKKLLNALIALLGQEQDNNSNDTLDAATYLVEDWKAHLLVAADCSSSITVTTAATRPRSWPSNAR